MLMISSEDMIAARQAQTHLYKLKNRRDYIHIFFRRSIHLAFAGVLIVFSLPVVQNLFSSQQVSSRD